MFITKKDIFFLDATILLKIFALIPIKSYRLPLVEVAKTWRIYL